MKTNLIICFIFISYFLKAQPGVLDPTFANEGIFSTSLGNYDDVSDVITLPDGKVVVLGGTYVPSVSDYEGWIVMLDENGNELFRKQLDLYDGEGGEYLEAIVFHEGALYIAGSLWDRMFEQYYGIICKVDIQGNLITSFGENGISNVYSDMYGLAIDEDGYLYGFGRTYSPNASQERGTVAKLKPSGEWDAAFGKGGVMTIQHSGNRTGATGAIIIDDYLYVHGWDQSSGPNYNAMLVKMSKNTGSIAQDFADNGFIIYDEGSYDYMTGAFPFNENMFLVQAEVGSDENDMLVARYDLDGQLDTSFGTQGIFRFDNGQDDDGSDIVLDANGNIYFGGSVNNIEDFGLICLHPDGSINQEFANGGVFIKNYNRADNLSSISLDQNNNILLGGESDDEGNADALVMRVKGFNSCENITETIALSDCGVVVFNGIDYYESNTVEAIFPAANGCDSIVTANITILDQSGETQEVTECDSVTINNKTYYDSGIFTQILTNSMGCDSILTINVAIQNSSSETVLVEQCEPVMINGELFSTTGIYIQKLTNAVGCDSVLTLEFTIVELVADITISENILVCENEGVSYQWIECETLEWIPGANEKTFTPSESGDYAVIVSDGLCEDTSSCISIVLTDLSDIYVDSNDLVLFPNPGQDIVFINYSQNSKIKSLTILDYSGRSIFAPFTFESSIYKIDVSSINSGMYFIIGQFENGESFVRKWLKE